MASSWRKARSAILGELKFATESPIGLDRLQSRPNHLACNSCCNGAKKAADSALDASRAVFITFFWDHIETSRVEFASSRMADPAFRQRDAIIRVDLRNAFNTIRHRPIFDAIVERYNPIARFFRWKYGTSSEMRDHSGKIVANTRTGVGQGDPWGGLLIELGYQAALLHLSQHVQDESAAYNRANPYSPLLKSGHVFAYEDDTQVMGPTPLFLPFLFFSVNIHKSYITGQLMDSF